LRDFYGYFSGFGHRVQKRHNPCPHFGNFVGSRQVNLLCNAQNRLFLSIKSSFLGIGTEKNPFMPISKKVLFFHMCRSWLIASSLNFNLFNIPIQLNGVQLSSLAPKSSVNSSL
ncbi:MAG: hypothetical protein IJX66_11740, partial [Lachnospiraceae bacterium]|nr:hypothetical protein [Lachnospiraceae bacterium]